MIYARHPSVTHEEIIVALTADFSGAQPRRGRNNGYENRVVRAAP